MGLIHLTGSVTRRNGSALMGAAVVGPPVNKPDGTEFPGGEGGCPAGGSMSGQSHGRVSTWMVLQEGQCRNSPSEGSVAGRTQVLGKVRFHGHSSSLCSRLAPG